MTFVLMREPQQDSRFFVAVPCSFLWRCVEQHVPDAQKNIPCGRIATRRELSKNDVEGILVYYNLLAFGVVSGGNQDVVYQHSSEALPVIPLMSVTKEFPSNAISNGVPLLPSTLSSS